MNFVIEAEPNLLVIFTKMKENLASVSFVGAMVILTKETLHLTNVKDLVYNILCSNEKFKLF